MEISGLSRSLSRFELGICICIIAVLFYYAVQKFADLSRFTEETGMDVLVRNMRSNLDLYKAEKLITGRNDELASMAGKNPVGKIFPRPKNYVGEFDSPDPDDFSPGQWYFDRSKGYLVYHVVNAEYFVSSVSAPARIRLTVAPAYIDVNENGVYDKDVDPVRGLTLDPVEPYRWK